ncbi:GntR family transcriptional regulator, partial [Acinetobacter baumannii]
MFRRFAPGTRLIEDVLMARYNASRHYVRQALAQMERQGIVQRVKNVGATVFTFTPEDIEQIFQVFGLLIRHAVHAIPLPAPASLIAELERLN